MRDFMEELREVMDNFTDLICDEAGKAVKYASEKKEAHKRREEYEAAKEELNNLFCEYGRLVFTDESIYGETKEELESQLKQTVERIEKLEESLTTKESDCNCNCEGGENCNCNCNCDGCCNCNSESKFCTKCGAKLRGDVLFCGKCGAKVK